MMVQTVITFNGAAQQVFPNLSGPAALARRVRIEPLRTNTHGMSVGTSGVTNGSGGTGVVQELAAPPASTLPIDAYFDDGGGSYNIVDISVLYVIGTNGEACTATYWTR